MDKWMDASFLMYFNSDNYILIFKNNKFVFFACFASQQFSSVIVHPSPNTLTPPTFIWIVFFKTQMSYSFNYSFIILCIYLHNKKLSTHLIVISLNIYLFP